MTTGLDHCVADMFYILAGIFTCYEYDLDSTEMNWGRLFYKNIIPVLLGNIVGGGFLMGMSFWYLNLHKDDSGYAKWGKNTLTDSKIKSSIDNAQKQNPDLSISGLSEPEIMSSLIPSICSKFSIPFHLTGLYSIKHFCLFQSQQ